jgi:Holliday junction resolvasome RuvABC endonuclease subunit
LKLLNRDKHNSADLEDHQKVEEQLLNIREETNLVAEVKDILDEVKIILTVVRIQEAVLEDITSLKNLHTEKLQEHHDIARRIISTTKNNFENMETQATEIRKAVSYC